MKTFSFGFAILTALASITGCTTPRSLSANLAIMHVTVIDPASRTVLPDQTVLIDDERIAGIYPAETVKITDGVVIDGEGKYLIPGLMDMHVHLSIVPILEPSLKLMLANGVTGIRDMSADCWEPNGELYLCIDDMRRVAAEIETGDRPGPRFLKLSSSFVQSDKTNRLPDQHDPLYTPATREDGAAIAAYLDDRGVDLIKLYHAIFADAFSGLMAEASRRNLEVSGHVPLLLGTRAASEAGVKTLEHAKEIVTDCSTYASDYRAAMNAVIAGEEGASWPRDGERLTGTAGTFDAAQCATLMQTLATNGTFYVPTHGTRELDFRAGDPQYRDNPNLRYIGDFQRKDWTRDLDRTAEATPERVDLYKRFYEIGLEVTNIAANNGVKIMLGTDANDTMIVPGFSVHEELARLVDAGLEPMAALEAATYTPAEYASMENEIGRIETGFRADMILLEGDPLTDITNSQSIDAVIFGGNYIDRGSLDAMLSEVAKAAAAKADRGDLAE